MSDIIPATPDEVRRYTSEHSFTVPADVVSWACLDGRHSECEEMVEHDRTVAGQHLLVLDPCMCSCHQRMP